MQTGDHGYDGKADHWCALAQGDAETPSLSFFLHLPACYNITQSFDEEEDLAMIMNLHENDDEYPNGVSSLPPSKVAPSIAVDVQIDSDNQNRQAQGIGLMSEASKTDDEEGDEWEDDKDDKEQRKE